MAIRVLHINAGNLYGGVETMLVTLARERTCCPGMAPHFAVCFEERFSDALTQAGTPSFFLGNVRLRYPWQVLRARRRLRELLKQHRFDVVICHMSWTLSIFGPVVRRASVPLVFWMHAPASDESFLDRRVRRMRPDLVIANSKFTAQSLPKLFLNPPAHVVVHPAVSEPQVQLAPAERAQLRTELQTSPDDVVVIQVSRMEVGKGHRVLVEALASMADAKWTLWMVGGGKEASGLKAFATERKIDDRVRFLGERDDIPSLLRAADLYCQPNESPEGFGISFIEALYAGLPVVTTRSGGALEILDDDCGRLVPVSDARALAQTLREVISDRQLRETLGNAGPNRAKTLCDPTLVSSQLESALQKAIH
jgi:glycosyltransferase involved in cell wall biosynthesis